MRRVLLTLMAIAGTLGTIFVGLSGHLMEDQRRHIAYEWLMLSIPLALLGTIPQIAEIWRKPRPDKDPATRPHKPDYKFKFNAY